MLRNPNELKRKRSEIGDQAQGILDKCLGENRGLSKVEQKQLDDLYVEAADLGRAIDAIEANNFNEMAGGQPIASFENATTIKSRSRVGGGVNITPEDRAFLKYCRKGIKALTSDESRALVEDTAGQYLVSPSIDAELQRTVEKLVPIRQLASKKQIDKDRLLVRSITEATMSWGKLETGGLISESTPVPTPEYKYVEDLSGLVKIGRDELDDNDYDLIKYLGETFGQAVAEMEQSAFIKGLGHDSEEPEGIATNTTLLAATKTTAASGAVTIDDFLQCIYAVPAKYRQGSSWIVNSTVELELRKLRWDGGGGAGTGGYFWQPAVALGAPNTFLGWPIYDVDDMDDLSDTAGVIALFGNFQRGYRILDRQGLRIQRLDEIYAESGLIGFLAYYRCGGYVINPANKPLVLLKEHA